MQTRRETDGQHQSARRYNLDADPLMPGFIFFAISTPGPRRHKASFRFNRLAVTKKRDGKKAAGDPEKKEAETGGLTLYAMSDVTS
jgi:hypothetical protein